MEGAELKAMRKQLGLTPTRAAAQVEVSARTWLRWESGQKQIPEGALKLFRILNKIEPLEEAK